MNDEPSGVSHVFTRGGAVLVVGAMFVVLALALYAGAASNEFIWDDPIVFQRQLPYFDSLGNVFFPPNRIPQFGTHYYRPATVLSYLGSEWAAETFWPLEERDDARRVTFHAAVVLWNALATLLVFLVGLSIARDTGRDGTGPLAVGMTGALLFAVHPIHSETVNWMAGCADVLCTVFILAALLFYLRARRLSDPVSTVLFGVSALAAMLTKETGVAVLFLVVLVELLFVRGAAAKGSAPPPMSRAERRRAARERKPARARQQGLPARAAAWVLLGLAMLTYFSLRHSAIATMTTPARRTPEPFTTAVFGSLGWYVKKALWPAPQSAFVADVPGMTYIALGLAVAILFLLALGWHLRRGSDWRAELFAGGFFLATLAPALAIALLSISETRLAERYLYVPSAGLCVLAGLLLERGARALGMSGTRRLLAPLAIASLIAVPAAWATIERGAVWRTDLAFWSDAVTKAPDSGLPFLHLGIAYVNRARDDREALDTDDATWRPQYEDALEQYRLAFQKYDDAEGRSKALNNSGSIHMQLGQYPEAIEAFRGALGEVPNYPTAYYNWSLAEYNLAATAADQESRQAHFARSLDYVQRALQLNPRYTKAHLHFGKSLRMMGGQEQRAREHLEQVLKLAPASREAVEARRELAR